MRRGALLCFKTGRAANLNETGRLSATYPVDNPAALMKQHRSAIALIAHLVGEPGHPYVILGMVRDLKETAAYQKYPQISRESVAKTVIKQS